MQQDLIDRKKADEDAKRMAKEDQLRLRGEEQKRKDEEELRKTREDQLMLQAQQNQAQQVQQEMKINETYQSQQFVPQSPQENMPVAPASGHEDVYSQQNHNQTGYVKQFETPYNNFKIDNLEQSFKEDMHYMKSVLEAQNESFKMQFQ